ncbi:hypothetical protein, conserved [Plasmodium gonderi]|uniref:DNA recombination and repair protein Rad51-like C-terminal domain-containing protein n=1 Tax=Plasmodium gonderi TaxID=77519 RepID=A0A1Y1JIG7_PLAGO|nr:hypothetical protein, conserved [Plasmodium gonderi]GAW81165.1 hypothetical protein, conserved [Plasmodium gonderi]
MANKYRESYKIDCTCLDLFEESAKIYNFSDCVIIKKCINGGTLREADSVCIYGREKCAKTLLLTEIVAELTAVKELKGMNCKVVYLDCDLTFNYKNYKNMIIQKFKKYINNDYSSILSNGASSKNINLKKVFLENSFSNVYYFRIFNPGHLLIILNTLKNLLKKKKFFEALFIDSLSFWNSCKYDKVNFFSDNNYVKRSASDLLDYAFTIILNLKKNYKFLFFYTKLCNEDKFIDYTVKFIIGRKGKQEKTSVIGEGTHKWKKRKEIHLTPKYYTSKEESFQVPYSFNDVLNTHIFRKRDFTSNNFLVEKPFFIYLIPNEKKHFIDIQQKDIPNLNFLMCLSSEMKDPNNSQYLKFFFMIAKSHTIIPL